jgi:cell division protein FtsB
MKGLPIDWRRVAIITGVLFLVVVIVDFNSRLEELDRLNRKAEAVRAEATQAAWTQTALETMVEHADSDQIVEEQARSEGHMILEGDQPVSVLGDDGEPPPTKLDPTPVPTPKPNWQLWWDLYFGED